MVDFNDVKGIIAQAGQACLDAAKMIKENAAKRFSNVKNDLEAEVYAEYYQHHLNLRNMALRARKEGNLALAEKLEEEERRVYEILISL